MVELNNERWERKRAPPVASKSFTGDRESHRRWRWHSRGGLWFRIG